MLTAMVREPDDSFLDCASLTCENMQMTAIEPLILYSRVECHLCDLAAAMMDRAGVPWRGVDVDADPDLARKYGIAVPVLLHPGSGRELFFPFDDEILQQFLDGET
jgi:glutaredoxin